MTAGRFGASDVTRTHDLLITNVSKVVNSLFSDAFYHLRIGHKEIRKQAAPLSMHGGIFPRGETRRISSSAVLSGVFLKNRDEKNPCRNQHSAIEDTSGRIRTHKYINSCTGKHLTNK